MKKFIIGKQYYILLQCSINIDTNIKYKEKQGNINLVIINISNLYCHYFVLYKAGSKLMQLIHPKNFCISPTILKSDIHKWAH